jgi:hypothetical protein
MALDRATHQHERLTKHLQHEKTRLESLLEGLMRLQDKISTRTIAKQQTT